MNDAQTTPEEKPGGLKRSTVAWIVVGTILVTAGLTWWILRTYIYAHDFRPVTLDSWEEAQLEAKLRALGYQPPPPELADRDRREGSADGQSESDQAWLRPEAYRDDAGRRTLFFTERELNALIARNRDLARRVAVDLSDDLVSVRALVHVDPDFPILGGKTLRVSGGVEMAFEQGRPVIRIRGLSIMGVPIPSAWMGGLKNVDLIREFGDAGGFWQAFAEGVEDIQVENGRLKITLKP